MFTQIVAITGITLAIMIAFIAIYRKNQLALRLGSVGILLLSVFLFLSIYTYSNTTYIQGHFIQEFNIKLKSEKSLFLFQYNNETKYAFLANINKNLTRNLNFDLQRKVFEVIDPTSIRNINTNSYFAVFKITPKFIKESNITIPTIGNNYLSLNNTLNFFEGESLDNFLNKTSLNETTKDNLKKVIISQFNTTDNFRSYLFFSFIYQIFKEKGSSYINSQLNKGNIVLSTSMNYPNINSLLPKGVLGNVILSQTVDKRTKIKNGVDISVG